MSDGDVGLNKFVLLCYERLYVNEIQGKKFVQAKLVCDEENAFHHGDLFFAIRHECTRRQVRCDRKWGN